MVSLCALPVFFSEAYHSVHSLYFYFHITNLLCFLVELDVFVLCSGSIAWTVWKSLPWADPKIVKVS